MIRVFVSNRSHHICSVLEDTVAFLNGYSVVGSFTCGRALYEFADIFNPDVYILDIALNDMNGFDIVRKLRQKFKPVKILVVADTIHHYAICRMIKQGVRGIISVQSTVEEISQALQDVVNGYHYNQLAPQSLFQDVRKGVIKVRRITIRQQEYMCHCYQGDNHPDIAKRMGVSWMSLKNFQNSIFTTLNVRTRAEMIRVGLESGLITSTYK